MSTFAVPPSQNTAPVLEFRCLYTHDQRQKQKRWQDGTLKYHTFNKRIMVYDESMNYVSDAHSKNDTLQDGDELRLQNGVLVEVSEAIRISHTDLTALLQRRQKPAVEQGHEQSQEQRIGNIGRLSTATRTILGGRTNPGTAPRPKHKSLNALLGDRSRRIGEGSLAAVSLRNETRNSRIREAENGPACKRQKKHPPEPRLWPVTANTKSSARPAPNQSVPQRERPLGAHRGKPPGTTKKTPKSHSVIAEQTSLTMKEVVDITSDDDCTLQSDLTFSDLSPSKPRSPERVSLRNECDGMIGRLPHATSHVRASPPANPVYQLQNADRRSRSGKSPTAPQKPSAPVERNPRAKALQLSKAKSKPKLLCMNNINLTEMQTSSRRRLHEPSTIPSDREANLAKPAKTSQKPPRRISSANRIINKDANLSPSSLPQRTLSSTVQGGSGEQSRGPRILKGACSHRLPTAPPPIPPQLFCSQFRTHQQVLKENSTKWLLRTGEWISSFYSPDLTKSNHHDLQDSHQQPAISDASNPKTVHAPSLALPPLQQHQPLSYHPLESKQPRVRSNHCVGSIA